MASSDAPAAALAAPASHVPAAEHAAAWSRRLLALALVLPWWLPMLGQASATFYKEALAALLVGFAGVVMPWPAVRPSARTVHPLLAAAAVLASCLMIQLALRPEAWGKTAMALVGLAVFALCLCMGRVLHAEEADRGYAWLARCIVVAAVGSALFAALQLFGLDRSLPFVLRRVGDRLYGNVAQANQFADLLWLGAVALVWLAATARLRTSVAVPLVLVLQFFAIASGSRAVWVYATLMLLLGIARWRTAREPAMRAVAVGLVVLAVSQVVLAGVVSATGVLERLHIASAEQRLADASGDESTSQRLWFWRSGLATAVEHPVLGVGIGRLAGAARERALETSDAPTRAADAHAHNLFIQIAGEAGIPAAVVALFAVGLWLIGGWRWASSRPQGLAALAMAGVMLVHADLEHPMAYLYVLALFGLVAGHVAWRPERAGSSDAAPGWSAVPRFASFAVLASAVVGYLGYMPVERATEAVAAQAQAGQPPLPTRDVILRLNAVPDWSPYTEFAETLGLMVSVPSRGNAAVLADRCERAVAYAPTAYLLARCAVDLEVAGRSRRAANFADSLCRLYPEAEPLLGQARSLVPGLATTGDVLVCRRREAVAGARTVAAR
jgi:O-antigen ligase